MATRIRQPGEIGSAGALLNASDDVDLEDEHLRARC